MGRETVAALTLDGCSATGKLLLEADEIILRGGLRARLPRSTITVVEVQGDDLLVTTTNGVLRAKLGAAQAMLWAKAIAKPAPTLAQKLGISQNTLLLLITQITDAKLIAVIGANAANPAGSAPKLMLAEVHGDIALHQIQTQAQTYPDAALWCVTFKGPDQPFSDAKLRQFMRDLGYVDTKSCSVSAQMTGTRYNRRRK